ncbi:CCA tRNA nucleotidyltransferase [Sporosarcina cascadiensis]|uniref:CCA tRNA nucleotidyltransferase n=1 Tax=Sporosarcina cascadiensis TaxID=2660747 RepID=UPI00129BEF08|nr:CCA tRNA nucleotidyltransferase [Sporosarcina cascadiensis]
MKTSFGSSASRSVVRQLAAAGYEAVFVGGAVRDFALGKEPADIDIATSALPEQVKEVFGHTVDIGIAHGTVLVILEGEPIEVTTFRTEGTYSDHRRPEGVFYVTSLKEDLQRRDFTINALAMTLDGELIDLFGGLQDLEDRFIRCVGNPAERFSEDALRIFRALRFTSVLDFRIEQETLDAMKKMAYELRHIARERIKTEMDKLLTGQNPSAAFQFSREIKLPELFPELFSSFERLDEYAPFRSVRHGWAAILALSESNASELARQFKLSNEDKRFLKQFEEASAKRKKHLFEELDLYDFPLDVLEITEMIHLSRYPNEKVEPVEELAARKQQLPIQQRSELAFTGTDLLEWSGRRGGKWTSEWIRIIEEAVVCRLIENDAQAIKEWFVYEISRKE